MQGPPAFYLSGRSLGCRTSAKAGSAQADQDDLPAVSQKGDERRVRFWATGCASTLRRGSSRFPTTTSGTLNPNALSPMKIIVGRQRADRLRSARLHSASTRNVVAQGVMSIHDGHRQVPKGLADHSTGHRPGHTGERMSVNRFPDDQRAPSC